jgi:hypothetical protein
MRVDNGGAMAARQGTWRTRMPLEVSRRASSDPAAVTTTCSVTPAFASSRARSHT